MKNDEILKEVLNDAFWEWAEGTEASPEEFCEQAIRIAISLKGKQDWAEFEKLIESKRKKYCFCEDVIVEQEGKPCFMCELAKEIKQKIKEMK